VASLEASQEAARDPTNHGEEMAELDEAIDELKANIAFLKAGVHTPDPEYDRRAAAGKAANDRNTPPPPPPTP